jgi:hypothetical protein
LSLSHLLIEEKFFNPVDIGMTEIEIYFHDEYDITTSPTLGKEHVEPPCSYIVGGGSTAHRLCYRFSRPN